jgi:outer membrane protein assembly factor BamE
MTHFKTPSTRFALMTSMALALGGLQAGCSTIDSASNSVASRLNPYRAEVVQGNVITQEQVAQLKPGLSKLQVRQVLGTPLVTSVFHENRWDYVFTIDRQGTEPQKRRLTLTFNGERLEKFEGDKMPTETEFIASISKPAASSKPPKLEASAEELARFQSPPVTAPAAPVAPATTTYPPLEGSGR